MFSKATLEPIEAFRRNAQPHECVKKGSGIPNGKRINGRSIHLCPANLTGICNGNCPFCINPGRKAGISPFDMGTFQDTLNRVREHVYGISLTGGEPMLTPYLVDDAVGAIADVFRNGEEIDLVTNGFQFDNILKLKNQASIFSIHLSKHRLSDDANDAFFGFHTVSWNELNQILSRLDDPGAIVLNCVVMKGGIDSVSQVKAYLEKASATGVRNVCFIGMNRSNSFCEEHYLDPFDLKLDEDPRIHIWSRYADYDYCHCMSGSCDGETCSIRFYLRGICPGPALRSSGDFPPGHDG